MNEQAERFGSTKLDREGRKKLASILLPRLSSVNSDIEGPNVSSQLVVGKIEH